MILKRRMVIIAIIIAIILIIAVLAVVFLTRQESDQSKDTVPPAKVAGLVVTDAKGGKLELTWNAADDNVAVVKYFIYRNGTKLATEPSDTNYLDTGLVSGTTYTYQVSAVDAAGNEGQKSDEVLSMPTNDTQPPSKVTGLIVTDAYNGKLSLGWNAATDDVGVVKYYIYRDGTKLASEPTATKYLDTGLVNGVSYSYQVSAVDDAGNEGQKSDEVSGTPTADITPPSQVNGLIVLDAHDGKLVLFWNAATDNVAVVKYLIYRDGIKVAESTSVTYQDTGLVNGVTYTYEVSAVDGAGNEGQKSLPEQGMPTSGGTKHIGTSLAMSADGKNWCVGFVSVDTGMPGSQVYLIIKDAGGNTVLSETALDILTYGTHNAVYDDLDGDKSNDVKVGDGVRLNKLTYPTGTYQLIFNAEIVGSGTLV